ncbi:MAG TPA: ROK family protein [Solirubrobacteraceae bacterium]|nr:ROK family protein [Solirubrobacteraceae bacterium]
MSAQGADSYVAVVDVGGTTLKGALADHGATLFLRDRRETSPDDGPEAVLEAIMCLIDDLVAEGTRRHGARGLAGIGVAIPGPVDERRGVVLDAPNLGWSDVPLREMAVARTGLQVFITHDVRAAASGEAVLGSARGAGDHLFVAMGTGIGAAVVIGGEPYAGTHATAGEMGHMTIDPDGPECGCGARGHVEAYASAGGMRRRYADATGGDVIPTELLVARAVAGDQPARRIWDQAIDALAIALADAIVLIDPGRVVIGGGLAAAGDRLFGPLRERVSRHLPFGRVPAITPAELGPEAGVRGMAVLTWRGIAQSASATTPPVAEPGVSASG